MSGRLRYLLCSTALQQGVDAQRDTYSGPLVMPPDLEASLQSFSLSTPQLPNSVILHILTILPPQQLPWARFIHKAAHHEFISYKHVSASCQELPSWTLQRMYAACTEDKQRHLLVQYRAAAGDAAAVQWLKNAPRMNPASCSPAVCAVAAGNGHIHVLRCLRSGQRPCPWDHTACTAAAAGGHLGALRFLRRQEPLCPWAGSEVWAAAAANGHFHILEYLKQQHCYGWGAETCTAAAGAGRADVLNWLTDHVLHQYPIRYDDGVFSAAVVGGHVHVLEWYKQREGRRHIYREGTADCTAAAGAGHLDVLKWLRSLEHPCSYSTATCAAAAAGGHLHILQWLRQQDPPCPWSPAVCTAAAEAGHLHVLEWARAQTPACPWDNKACAAAAKKGHLEVLKWLRAQDPPCPWSEDVCLAAAEGCQLEVLQWLRSQTPPCPWDKRRVMSRAAMGNWPYTVEPVASDQVVLQDEMFEWLMQLPDSGDSDGYGAGQQHNNYSCQGWSH